MFEATSDGSPTPARTAAPYRRPAKRWSLALAMAVALFVALGHVSSAEAQGTATAAAASRQWRFEVLLNDSPIGEHRFAVSRDGDTTRLKTTAKFDVKIAFVNAYRYRHDATETWRGNCLTSLDAATDDDGKNTKVTARASEGRTQVESPDGSQTLPACVMTFAYWNPDMLKQAKLLNTQTGLYTDVSIAALGDDSVRVGDTTIRAKHYRLTGTKEPIELWYSPQGDWLGLRTQVAGGRTLTYRLTDDAR